MEVSGKPARSGQADTHLSKRTSWLALPLIAAPFAMGYGAVQAAIGGSGWLAADRFGLGFVVLAGILVALPPLFGDGKGLLLRWDHALLQRQDRLLAGGRQALRRVVPWLLRITAGVVLLVVDTLLIHSGGGFLSRGYYYYVAGLVWTIFVLVLVYVVAFFLWLASKPPRSEGLQLRDIYEALFSPSRREVTLAIALMLFLCGSVMQYFAFGHEMRSPRPPVNHQQAVTATGHARAARFVVASASGRGASAPARLSPDAASIARRPPPPSPRAT